MELLFLTETKAHLKKFSNCGASEKRNLRQSDEEILQQPKSQTLY